MKTYLNQNKQILLAAGAATVLIFIVNAIIPSYVNGFSFGLKFSFERLLDNEGMDEIFHMRFGDSEYSRRLIVLGVQNAAHKIGISYQLTFSIINIIANYCFFFFSYRLANLVYSKLDPWAFTIFLSLSLPVLFAYLPVIYTYDDTVQFALLSGFFICLYKERHLGAYILFFLACLSRETSLLFGAFLPVYFWLKDKSFIRLVLSLLPYAMIVLVYVLILYLRMDEEALAQSSEYMTEMRFYWYKANFANGFRVVEIIYYILGVYLFPMLILDIKVLLREKNPIFMGFISLFILNLILSLITVNASEARYYTMTLIPVFPLFAEGLQKVWYYIKERKHFSFKWLVLSVLLTLAMLAFYSPEIKGAFYVFGPYMLVYFTICFYLIFNKKVIIGDKTNR